ncbi:hypothetical protein AURDEDRAFT_167298 [Auricularia subglabra TFB-10046 SS5]|nr:hypothetical protein AURDEDRAFT_167298 [Auricularia subglabra TFB-10046 SS5]
MCHTSPSTFLVWSLLSTTLFVFLVSHLWSFDRFRCLRWGAGSGSGAFKRVMTYTYLLSVPLICSYSIGFTYIKYTEGWVDIPRAGGGAWIIPKPYQLWSPLHQRMVFPLYMIFSCAWGLEMCDQRRPSVSMMACSSSTPFRIRVDLPHPNPNLGATELCFWLFLLRSSSGKGETHWFRSAHFKLWATGSLLGGVGIPLVTVFKRQNPLEAEAWTFLIASSGSLLLTLLFLPVLFGFPAFLRRLKAEGTQRRVVLRLCHFHDINIIRVSFRFVFVLPLFVLGLDGVLPNPVINESLFWTDILAIASAMGCCASSVMTLLIFFPRDLESEAGYRTTRASVAGTEMGAYDPSEKLSGARGPAPARPPRPDSVASFETPVQPSWGDGTSRGYSGYSVQTAEIPPNSATPMVRVVRGDVVEEDGAAFELYHADQMYSSSAALQHKIAADAEGYPGPAREDASAPAPPAAQPKRVRPTQQWNQPGQTPYFHQQQQQHHAVYPPHAPRGRFGGPSPSASAPDVRSSRLTVHPMVRNYRSPIDLIDSYYQTSNGNYV